MWTTDQTPSVVLTNASSIRGLDTDSRDEKFRPFFCTHTHSVRLPVFGQGLVKSEVDMHIKKKRQDRDIENVIWNRHSS